MTIKMRKLFLISLLTGILCFLNFPEVHGKGKTDSMVASLDNTRADTTRVNMLLKLAKKFPYTDSGIAFCNKAIDLTEKIYYPEGRAKSFKTKGILSWYQAKYAEALENLLKAKKAYKEIGNEKEVASVVANIGSIYNKRGAYDDALQKYFEALPIIEKLDKKLLLSKLFNNIGDIYTKQKNYEKAREYYKKSITIKKRLQDSSGLATTFNNLGNVIYEQKAKANKDVTVKKTKKASDSARAVEKLKKALSYYQLSLEYCGNNESYQARAYKNIGLVYLDRGKLDSSLHYTNKALQLNKEAKNVGGRIHAYLGKGEIFFKQSQWKKAIDNFHSAEKLARKIGNTLQLKNASEGLAKAYKAIDEYEQAYEYLKKEANLKDTLFSQERAEQIQKIELKEKRRKAKKQARLEKKKEQRRHRLQYSGIFIGLVFLFAFVFLSGKFTLPFKFAEGFIFFNFILLFEFILVILDPIIDDVSGGAPLIKLGFNAVLALFIFPAHSFFEDKLKKRVVPGYIPYNQMKKS